MRTRKKTSTMKSTTNCDLVDLSFTRSPSQQTGLKSIAVFGPQGASHN